MKVRAGKVEPVIDLNERRLSCRRGKPANLHAVDQETRGADHTPAHAGTRSAEAGVRSGRSCSTGIAVNAEIRIKCRGGILLHCVTAEGTIPNAAASLAGPPMVLRTRARGASYAMPLKVQNICAVCKG